MSRWHREHPEKGNQVEPPAPALPERWVATSSPANPCTICGRPFESADPFVGDGDGMGQRFAHLGCYRGREYQRENDKAYDRKAKLAEHAEHLVRIARAYVVIVGSKAVDRERAGDPTTAAIYHAARNEAEELLSKIEGTTEEGNKP